MAPPAGEPVLLDPNQQMPQQVPAGMQMFPPTGFVPGYIPVQTGHVPLDTPFLMSPENLAHQQQIWSDNHLNYEYGKMRVQLDRAHYYPGETVNGKVFI